jgi:hypothetical protein
VAWRSIGKLVPASAAAPSGHSSSRSAGCGEAHPVPPQHLEISEQMMAERDRLRGLQVGEARHHAVGMLLGAVDQHALEVSRGSIEFGKGGPHPHAKIGRDLIVARARGVQSPRRRPDQLAQAMLHMHVDVLELLPARHAIRLILGRDPLQPGQDRLGIRSGDDALIAQHRRMRARARQILAPQPRIDIDRGVDLAHDRRRPAAETAAPHAAARFVLLAHRRGPRVPGAPLQRDGAPELSPDRRRFRGRYPGAGGARSARR